MAASPAFLTQNFNPMSREAWWAAILCRITRVEHNLATNNNDKEIEVRNQKQESILNKPPQASKGHNLDPLQSCSLFSKWRFQRLSVLAPRMKPIKLVHVIKKSYKTCGIWNIYRHEFTGITKDIQIMLKTTYLQIITVIIPQRHCRKYLFIVNCETYSIDFPHFKYLCWYLFLDYILISLLIHSYVLVSNSHIRKIVS